MFMVYGHLFIDLHLITIRSTNSSGNKSSSSNSSISSSNGTFIILYNIKNSNLYQISVQLYVCVIYVKERAWYTPINLTKNSIKTL